MSSSTTDFHLRRLTPNKPKVVPMAASVGYFSLSDSTMKRLFGLSSLKAILVQEQIQDGYLGQVTCDEHEADRCDIYANFGLPYVDHWIALNPHVFEGPKKFGAQNAYCSDCLGCQTLFLECRSNNGVDASDIMTERSLSK